VIGVGNAFRSDDSAGLAAAHALRDRLPEGVELLEREGEPTSLIDAWDGAEAVWLLDAAASGAEPGTVHRFVATEQALPAEAFVTSSHHLGLADAIELARAVGRLPGRLVVFGIEGASFDAGESLTPAVAEGAERAAEAVLAEVAAFQGRAGAQG